MRASKIAILVPSYNGGALLAETVASAAVAGLPPDSYEIVVCDNASTDGSADALPPRDAQGAAITLRRNARNLGRVANWNRAIEVAEEMGFGFALFLMVGDLVQGRGLIALRDRMVAAGACLGIASYEIVDEALRPQRVARRILWRGAAGLPARDFLTQSLATGAMLYGPLGANLYWLGGGRGHLRFDPGDESHTDQLATAVFTRVAGGGTGGVVTYLDKPISRWRARPGRFHSGMDPRGRLASDVRVMERACQAAGVATDHPRIRASVLLRAIWLTRGDLRAAWAWSGALVPAAPSWTWLFRLLFRQALHKTPWLVKA
ncbi:glycosyltransferase family 2 protein [Nitrospirillum sp. BR 11828]|uniref:glycosyltransferase family 2 protein n=1 Tax=Nitrospirillum sp. BR 11828 TaxID=3104325 RepID=UPI002ACAC019|nr:glycosyltransferase [Nitrospirillum sp. BR 11828]MDZ5650110.1 glycosyltransferase [Nitrospirillum sp. BR 11828]